MPRSMLSIVMLCLTYAVLSGCGTKGPLYIPEQRYPQKTPEVNSDKTSQPSPQTPVKE